MNSMAETPRDAPLTAVVIIGGGPLHARALAALEAVNTDVRIIAADSGLDHAVSAGLRPDALVGDLDSISASGRMWAYAHELLIDTHPEAKDETDTELALAAAVALTDAQHLLLLGGLDPLSDDRLDHLLGTLLSLGHPSLGRFSSVSAVVGSSEVRVVHGGRSLALPLDGGQTFSLLALHGVCTGVTLTGAHWPLAAATLTSTEARGLSNISDGDTVVRVADGVLTVVIP